MLGSSHSPHLKTILVPKYEEPSASSQKKSIDQTITVLHSIRALTKRLKTSGSTRFSGWPLHCKCEGVCVDVLLNIQQLEDIFLTLLDLLQFHGRNNNNKKLKLKGIVDLGAPQRFHLAYPWKQGSSPRPSSYISLHSTDALELKINISQKYSYRTQNPLKRKLTNNLQLYYIGQTGDVTPLSWLRKPTRQLQQVSLTITVERMGIKPTMGYTVQNFGVKVGSGLRVCLDGRQVLPVPHVVVSHVYFTYVLSIA
ncbi:hypothetical protein J6590_081628 [Homalodisca vitripennis]|nr:hypothetical protein J6590_081628 [Homalodisca vitripennis]